MKPLNEWNHLIDLINLFKINYLFMCSFLYTFFRLPDESCIALEKFLIAAGLQGNDKAGEFPQSQNMSKSGAA